MNKKTGLNLANKITLTRIILVPLFVAAVIYSRLEIALLIFVLAVISDGADGFVARTLKQKTELGTILDPIADKILLVTAYISLSMASGVPQNLRLPPYVPIIVISRDAIIVLGSIMVHVITGNLKISPSVMGKTTTFFQMITIVSVLVKFKYSFIVWNIAVIFTILSGIDYVIKGSRLFGENHAFSKKEA